MRLIPRNPAPPVIRTLCWSIRISLYIRHHRAHRGPCKRRILACQHAPADSSLCVGSSSVGAAAVVWSACWLRIVYNCRDDTRLG